MSRVVQRWLARLLIAVGAIVLMWVAVNDVESTSVRSDARAHAIVAGSRGTGRTGVAPGGRADRNVGDCARGFVRHVVEGDDDSVLDRAIGHLPDTPLPWYSGNSALAAHRDALFRPLRGVRLGDVFLLKTPHRDFDYVVRETVIVEPDDLWVLDPTPVSMLTLISCYPFNFIGNAPKRFIVRAERMPTRPQTSAKGWAR